MKKMERVQAAHNNHIKAEKHRAALLRSLIKDYIKGQVQHMCTQYIKHKMKIEKKKQKKKDNKRKLSKKKKRELSMSV